MNPDALIRVRIIASVVFSFSCFEYIRWLQRCRVDKNDYLLSKNATYILKRTKKQIFLLNDHTNEKIQKRNIELSTTYTHAVMRVCVCIELSVGAVTGLVIIVSSNWEAAGKRERERK